MIVTERSYLRSLGGTPTHITPYSLYEFKDNVAYPWSAGVSNLIQYPEAANQTLYTQRAARSDSGNYTCRISNETHSQQHTIYLEVLEKEPDKPRTMFVSKDQWVPGGGAVRLFCEALVGRSYLADAHSDLRWIKLWANNSEGDLLPSQREIKTTRDDMAGIIGSYLVVESAAAPDYGTYACVVTSNDAVSKTYVTVHYDNGLQSPLPPAEHAIPWRALLLSAACAALLTVSALALHRRCTPRLLLAARIVHARANATTQRARAESPLADSRALLAPWRALLVSAACAALVAVSALALHRRCTPRLLLAARIVHARANATTQRARVLEKEFDVVVCWTRVDEAVARGALLPTLAGKYHYRVQPVPLHTPPDTWYNTLLPEVSRCRSLVALMSPTQYSPAQLMTALRQLRALPVPPVIVLLQDLPKLKREAKDSSGESLVSLLRRSRLLAWRHVHERAFWTELRLALPLPPRHIEKEVKVEVDESKNSRSGSLTALV
ncbi:unnamed protein product [Plutella xylostella]|uniref:Soluble interferon alpha/beta receptor OPG204 n=1 Tax=Plutella xylostella TaxID=51655 RepID=A0A8S4DUI3_PLUXY|nr:unnamed protein product [Plutella xylostella]